MRATPSARHVALLVLLNCASISHAQDDQFWAISAASPYGRITIDTTPDEGIWTLTGPPGFIGLTSIGDRIGSQTITHAPPGDYTLVCDDNVAGLTPPSSQTLTLVAEGRIAFTPAWRHETLTVYLPGDEPMELVRVPAGSFQMGSNDGPDWSWCPECAQPVHTVNIGYDFYMGKYEVTQLQWLAVMGSWPGEPPYVPGDSLPADQIGWVDIAGAGGFLDTLNAHLATTAQPGNLRLPSEAEWEYSCRAGSTTRFCFGDSDCSASEWDPCQLDDYAWWAGNNTESGPKPVGGKLPNAFGLYDMHGNIYEWCQDTWHHNYVGAPTDGSARGGAGPGRALRSGVYHDAAGVCRSAERFPATSPDRFPDVGFRVAR